MFTGQIAEISNRADWTGPFCQLVNEDDGSIINLLNQDVAFDCSVYIKLLRRHADYYAWHVDPIIIGSIANGKVIASQGDDGAGFQWKFLESDLRCLHPGTYRFGVKTTTNGEVNDLVDGTLVIVEGN